MINNRQGGRRRGRGGQRSQNLGQPGNRQDNRQRGNAAQLLEKYKNMARDAQLAGDRVQSEYYLQFADHYYRILGESRARFEEQRRQRGESGDEDEDTEQSSSSNERFANDRFGQEEELAESADEPREQRDERREFTERQSRGNGRDRSRGNGRPRPEPSEQEERIAVDVLPPAIGQDQETEEERPAPRRRSRRPTAKDDGGEIAPAA